MTRRRVDYSIEPDMFGFDPLGHDFTVTVKERQSLLGMGPLCMALYYTCLKPFAKGNGRVYALSYYRLEQLLRHKQNAGGGPRFEDPTVKQVRSALARLVVAGLVVKSDALNEQKGVLQIWLVHGVGGTASDSVRAGVKAGSKRPKTPMNTEDAP